MTPVEQQFKHDPPHSYGDCDRVRLKLPIFVLPPGAS